MRIIYFSCLVTFLFLDLPVFCESYEATTGNGQSLTKREAQFGLVGASQHCIGSLCNQNNIVKRKKSIAEAINALAEEEIEAERQVRDAPADRFGVGGEISQNNFVGRKKREAKNCEGSACNQNNLGGGGALGVFPSGFGASQNCVGSDCKQNNFGKKREAQVRSYEESSFNHNKYGGGGLVGVNGFSGLVGGFEGGVGASQDCVGSQCKHTDIESRKKREVLAKLIEEVHKIADELMKVESREALLKASAQINLSREKRKYSPGMRSGIGGYTGFGSFQNRFGIKKREVVEDLQDEALEAEQKVVDEAIKSEVKKEVTGEEKSEVEMEATNLVEGSPAEGEVLDKSVKSEAKMEVPDEVDYLVFDEVLGVDEEIVKEPMNLDTEAEQERISSTTPASSTRSPTSSTLKEASPVHVMQCSGTSSSSCDNKRCTVKCSDGNKVELECATNSVAVNSNDVNGKTVNEVSCGSPEDTHSTLPACFPFCG